MSWTAYATDRYYRHCANVLIDGAKDGKLPDLDMTIVDVAARHQKVNVHVKGDTGPSGPGPNPCEKELSTNGFYTFGGASKGCGIDLGLVMAH
ncbi:hypothetical protein BGX21_007066 [Mortierella sp. AD011]|nr:hypothetical protein BGX20_004959 [Mortierella sp. AD010]KAF9398927.1 hypothetical protein BGX21_007066 [Mortierella sp. AD011]